MDGKKLRISHLIMLLVISYLTLAKLMGVLSSKRLKSASQSNT